MSLRRGMGVAELAQQIADEVFPRFGTAASDPARIQRNCRRLGRVASFRTTSASELVALARTAPDERLKAVAALAVLGDRRRVVDR